MKNSAACPSDLALERFLLEELPETRTDLADHIDACAACSEKVVAKRSDNVAFERSPGAARVRALVAAEVGTTAERRRPAVSGRPRFVAAFAALALAAAMAISFAVRHRRVPSSVPIAAASDEQAVLRVQREWMEAIRDKDAAALNRILADDYTYTDSRGRVTTKADSLRQAGATRSYMKSFQTFDEKARIYGDTAIITGRLRVEGVAGGEPYDAEVRFTDILARIDGQWRAVAAHASAR